MDLHDKHIHQIIEKEKLDNENRFKACKSCGDKGVYLVSEDSKYGYNQLVVKYCHCNTGTNLMNRHNNSKQSKE